MLSGIDKTSGNIPNQQIILSKTRLDNLNFIFVLIESHTKVNKTCACFCCQSVRSLAGVSRLVTIASLA